MALLLALVFGLGIWMSGLSVFDSAYPVAVSLHTGIAVLIAVLLPLRLLWRLGSMTPPPLSSSPWVIWAGRLVRVALYALMLAAVCSGYLLVTGSGRGLDVFGLLVLPALFNLLPGTLERVGQLHQLSVWLLALLVVLHLAAALWHHMLLRDNTLRRMLP